MPVDYSKFDHIEDSDDDRPDPRQTEEAKRRRELAEELKAQLFAAGAADPPGTSDGDSKDSGAVEKPEAAADTPAHRADRFAHSEADVTGPAQETLRQSLARTPGVKVAGGLLSVVAAEKFAGEAMKAQIRGESRYIFDLSFVLKVAFKWMGANFDAGMLRAEGAVTVRDFASEATLDSAANPPIVSFAWTDAGALGPRQAEAEAAIGVGSWPPVPGSLLAEVVVVLREWMAQLPEHVLRHAEAARQARREEADRGLPGA